MFRKLLLPSIALACLVVLSSGELSDNGKAGKTGSPGELACNDCHDNFALNSGGGSVTLSSSNMPGWEYIPGTTYHMTATVARTGDPLFGIGLECLTSNNQNAGTLTITNSNTQIKNATVSGVSRRNVVHTLDGGATANSMPFNFDWVAPATNIGNVTFYYAGVAANADGDETSGDHVYTGSQVVTPSLSTGIERLNTPNAAYAYPNPAVDMINVVYNSSASGTVRIGLYDVNGRAVEELVNTTRGAGQQAEVITGLQRFSPGTYILRTTINGHAQDQRIVIADRAN